MENVITDSKKQTKFMTALAVTSIVTMMNTTTVSVSLPSFMQIFAIDVRTVQWVVVGYMLPLGMCMPLSGYLGEKYGYKRVYLLMLIMMGLASIGCALSWSFYSLVAFRFLKGIFSGIINPFTISMIYYYMPKNKQVKYLGISNMTNAFGVAVGPTLAGFILQYSSWHFLFLFNIPLVIVAYWLSSKALPNSKGNANIAKVDIMGILQVCLGTGMVLFAFTNLEIWGGRSLKFWAVILSGIVLLVIFIMRQQNIANPLLNFRVLKYRPFAVTVLVTACLAIILGVTGVLNNLFMQTLLGLSPLTAGMAMFIPSIVLICSTEFTAIIYKKLTSRTLVVGGLLLIVVGNFLLSRCTLMTSVFWVIMCLSIRYWGLGMAQTPLSDYGMKIIPQEMVGHASSMMSWCRQIVSVVSTNILTILLSINTARYYLRMTASEVVDSSSLMYDQAMLQAVNMDYFYLAVCMVIAALIAFFMMREAK